MFAPMVVRPLSLCPLLLLAALAGSSAPRPAPGHPGADGARGPHASAPRPSRVATARIARVVTAVATLEGVTIRLEWPDRAEQGRLQLSADRVAAPDLGYRFRNVHWVCPVRRRGADWACDGELRVHGASALRLAVDLGPAFTQARLLGQGARVELTRNAATPDLTRLDLTRVPVAWAQALTASAWPEGRLTGGRFDANLGLRTHDEDGELHVSGPLRVDEGAFDTPDGTVAGEGLTAELELDLAFGRRDRVGLRGHLQGGELLFGPAYLSLGQRRVSVSLQAEQGEETGWRIPVLTWNDPGVLVAQAQAALAPDASLHALDLRWEAPDLAPLRDAYLSGWLGMAGLAELAMQGQARGQLVLKDGQVQAARAELEQVGLDDARPGAPARFRFDGLDGDVAYAADGAVESELRWQGGALYGLAFGPSRLPFRSDAGVLAFAGPVDLEWLGGRARFDAMRLRPPGAGTGLQVEFGLALDRVDVAQLAGALDWPAFTGELSGRIPRAVYRDDRLSFEGGLEMAVFGGQVSVSALSMERPFGVAPTLSADIRFDDLDLHALTGVFGFGSITGALDGHLRDLRLVNWEPVAFDARLRTDRKRGVPQRISQRAVQDLSSVGDASFVNSLQSRVIGLFDDFGYARIGVDCVLADEVCVMGGLGAAGPGFIIVEGAGLPRLTVVGYNRRVDWPTLLDRLAAVGKGDVKPVVD